MLGQDWAELGRMGRTGQNQGRTGQGSRAEPDFDIAAKQMPEVVQFQYRC